MFVPNFRFLLFFVGPRDVTNTKTHTARLSHMTELLSRFVGWVGYENKFFASNNYPKLELATVKYSH